MSETEPTKTPWKNGYYITDQQYSSGFCKVDGQKVTSYSFIKFIDYPDLLDDDKEEDEKGTCGLCPA